MIRASADETIIELEKLIERPMELAVFEALGAPPPPFAHVSTEIRDGMLEDAEDLALAHALRIGAYGQKRIFSLTEEVIAEARAAVGAHPRVLLAEGDLRGRRVVASAARPLPLRSAAP